MVAITCADVPKKCTKPHEECKDTYKGPVCNCEHGCKRKYGHCVGKKIASLIYYFKYTQHIKFMIGLGSYFIQKTTTSNCIAVHLDVILYVI
jgi:hypothetical protein